MDRKQIEKIYTLVDSGLKTSKIAELQDCSTGQVCCVARIAKFAQQNDIENLKRETKPHGTIVRWACEKWGIELGGKPKTEPKPNDDLLLNTLAELLQEIKRLNEQLVKLG